MSTVALSARLLLAAVFAVAGAAKLADRKGSAKAAEDFGVPKALVGAVAVLLPIAELATAALLIVPQTARAGAAVALGLLLLFCAGIGRAMARGEAPDCHCFGQVHSEPAGAKTLIRNALLAAVAAFVLLASDTGPSPVGWLGELSGTEQGLLAAIGALAVVVALQARFMAALLRQNGRILKRLDALEAGAPAPDEDTDAQGGLPVGAPAPDFTLPGLDGVPVSLDALRTPGRPVLLLFTDPDCGPCSALLPQVATWQRDHPDAFTLTVVSRGTPEANRAKADEHGLGRILLQDDREVSLAYDAPATPTAVLVAADGTIASATHPGADAIARLVARAAGTQAPALQVIPPQPAPVAVPAPPPALPVGATPPAVDLIDLDGERVDLTDPRATGRVLIFWNPACGFCSQMVDDLRAWEDSAPADAPELLLISSGTAEENRAMGLRARIVLDPSFSVGRAFGTTGTPTAVRLDDRGLVASPVAIGQAAVLALASGVGYPS